MSRPSILFVIPLCMIIVFLCINIINHTLWLLEEPTHAKLTHCTVNKCNITSATCYKEQCQNYGEHCVDLPFTCYSFVVDINTTISNQYYNKTIQSNYDVFGRYPTIYNRNVSECTYDDRNVLPTLNVFGLELITNKDYCWLLVKLYVYGCIILFIGAIIKVRLCN